MRNSTAVSEEEAFERMALFLEDPHFKWYLVAILVFNFISSILASVFNFLVVLTFLKTSSLRTPSYILILGLSFSDLGVGGVTQPMYCCRLIAWLTKNFSLYKTIYSGFQIAYDWLIYGSLLTVTAITIDRFLAVHLHLRYQRLVTIQRSYGILAAIWVFSLSWSLALTANKVWLKISHYCFKLMNVLVVILLMKDISRVIHKHTAQIQAQQMNMQRYKKSVNVMYYIMGVYLVCYLPGFIFFVVFNVLKITRHDTTGIEILYAELLASTIVMLNSALNPIIYCWRIEEIRNALLKLVRRQ